LSGDSNNVAAEVIDNQLTLTPATNWNGAVYISVTVSDGELEDSEVFELTVTPVNDPPVADDDEAEVDEDESVSGNVMDNDSDLDANFNDPTEYSELSVILVDSTDNGIVNLNANGSWVYTPDLNYNGPDSFSYELA
jgi:hypothetical protein